ncbi:MAG: class III poly(R)-hydroxyalkanoic acid synthase subunit PhaE [Magnetococcales bacterium]|nr:class III poly(R)-hydroxyalkanoic acid synthase subunit PhaE [Magnetococcales bacterium]
MQKKSMTAWMDALGQTWTGGGSLPAGDMGIRMWKEGLERWQKLLPPFMSGGMPGQDIMRGLMSSNENYIRFAEMFFKGFSQLREMQTAGGNWKEALDKTIDQMKGLFTAPLGGKALGEGMMGYFGQSMEAWNRLASTAMQLPENPFQNIMGPSLMAGSKIGREQLEKIMAMPPIGPNPDVQKKWKEWALLALKFQEAMETYMGHIGKVGPAALDKLKEKLLKMAEKGEKVETLKDLFSLWVDAGDSAFSDMTNTKEYRDANAEMVHALMRMKIQGQIIMDDQMESMNLPSRRELNTTHKRVIELKRRFRDLEGRLGTVAKVDVAADLNRLRGEIEALKHEVAELKGGKAAAAAAAAKKPQGKGE